MKILIIIPAYNEEENISGVIRDVRTHFQEGEILVINDGSDDNTSSVAKAFGVDVINLPFNLGIGGAMQTGFLYAFNKGYDLVIQFDGDGQHDAEEIGNILEPHKSNTVDLVIGSRYLSQSYFISSIPRLIGGRVLSLIVSAILWMKITDATSGFRAYGREAIKCFAVNYPVDYPEVEAVVLAHKRGLKILEVPANFRARIGGKSSITTIRAIYYMIKVLLAVFVDLLKKI